MSGRPTVAWILSLASGIIILLLGSLASGALFLPVLISGVLLLAGGVMLYFRPSSRALWSVLVLVVAVADLAGIAYIFFSPSVGGVTLLGSLGPLLGLAGGVAGLLWKPTEARPQPTSTN
jgi:hypothetical protein